MTLSAPLTTALPAALTWDIFCRVIDNHGDLGVCWRLGCDLAHRGHAVRLWVDDASALSWMAPSGCTGIEIRTWPSDVYLQTLRHEPFFQVGDVVIEAFGCELPRAFQALIARRTPPPVWINLEYLSAQDYVARSHGLASPVLSGPARGALKWFFFPGFTTGTGGLLREPHLMARQTAFDRSTWLNALPVNKPIAADEQLVSLFCYEPAALTELLKFLSEGAIRTRLLVTPGRPSAAVTSATQTLNMPREGHGQLCLSPLPYLDQSEFDHLLWACDLNFVRGEDSLVRALWAGQALVWQLYPQDDLAHHAKLEAFETALDMPASLKQFHAHWNGLEGTQLPALSPAVLGEWRQWCQNVRRGLLEQADLTDNLLHFVALKL